MYNPETGEIAKPSELLASVKAYMSVLQSVENYVNIDITRVFNNVLLQQTQQVGYFLLHSIVNLGFTTGEDHIEIKINPNVAKRI